MTLVAGRVVEVTTLRRDVATDGRRAVVEFSSDMDADAARRDLTINALYAYPDGVVHDPMGGYDDLMARRIRFIGDAGHRIREDYLRSLRFFRFYAWYGDPDHGPDPDALAAISANLDGLETVSRERVGAEIKKLLTAPDPARATAAMAQTGVLSLILPGADAYCLALLVHFEGQAGAGPAPIRRLAGSWWFGHHQVPAAQPGRSCKSGRDPNRRSAARSTFGAGLPVGWRPGAGRGSGAGGADRDGTTWHRAGRYRPRGGGEISHQGARSGSARRAGAWQTAESARGSLDRLGFQACARGASGLTV